MQNIPAARLRKLRTWKPGAKTWELISSVPNKKNINLIDLASNDYLGLSKHPRIIAAAHKSMISEGVGSGGSRLVTGSRPIHKTLEKELSQWLGVESVLLFPSGFQANLAAINVLANRNTTVIADKLIHHSLLIGIKSSGAKLKRFAHNNVDDLERLIINCLRQSPNNSPLVITESLFSMEGTTPNLNKIAELCNAYKAQLLVDEAHALGILGDQGRGLCYGLKAPITMISGTFGKAFGSGGAFLATNQTLGENIIQRSGAFRYTTALAPPLAAAALEALNLIKSNPDWGQNLQIESKIWRTSLLKKGWKCQQGTNHIIPLILGNDEESLSKQRQLEEDGLLTIAIRPPTVPEGTSRLRITIRRELPANALNKLLTSLDKQK